MFVCVCVYVCVCVCAVNTHVKKGKRNVKTQMKAHTRDRQKIKIVRGLYTKDVVALSNKGFEGHTASIH